MELNYIELGEQVAAGIFEILSELDVGVRSVATMHISDKGRGDVVTELDTGVELRLRTFLAPLISGAVVQGEETSGTARDLPGFSWTVDPIDGTVNFSRGLPPFTTSVLLSKDGKPTLGVIVDPIAVRALISVSGQGSHLMGAPGLSLVSTAAKSRDLPHCLSTLMITPKMDDRARTDSLAVADKLFVATLGVRLLVSQAYEAFQFAIGELDGVVTLYSSGGWTSGAAKLACLESGGTVATIRSDIPDRKMGFALCASEEYVELLRSTLMPLGYTLTLTLGTQS